MTFIRKIRVCLIFVFTLLMTTNAFASMSQGEITLDLYPQENSHIYLVGYTDEGKSFWYKIGQPPSQEGGMTKRLLLVHFDDISKNFFVFKGDVMQIIPINREYTLKYHKKGELPENVNDSVPMVDTSLKKAEKVETKTLQLPK
jgi:hypothetical protein